MKPLLNPAEVAARAFAMPFASLSYPRGPYRFINREYLTIKGAWSGPAALELHAHALAPVTDLPAREVISAVHILADLTLWLGEVVHDYLA